MAHRIELRARANQHFTYGGLSLLVTALDGRVGDRGLEGFYADETRLLCRFDLSADGVPLAPVAASRGPKTPVRPAGDRLRHCGARRR